MTSPSTRVFIVDGEELDSVMFLRIAISHGLEPREDGNYYTSDAWDHLLLEGYEIEVKDQEAE